MEEYLDKEPPKVVDRRPAAPATSNQHAPPPTDSSLAETGNNDSIVLHQKHRKSSDMCKTSEINFSRLSQGCTTRDSSSAPPGDSLQNERSPAHSVALENDIKEIRRLLKNYIVRLENKDTQAKNAKEWRLVARVMDRLFFFSYIGTIAVSLMTAFPKDVPDTWVRPTGAGSTAETLY